MVYKRTPIVASRNEAGRLSLKSKIYENILKFWIHLENLPENSIAYQCLQISENLARFSSKTSFISSVNKIVDLFQARNQQNTNVNFKDKDDSSQWLIDMKQNIEHQSKIHQIKLLNSNRKLVFYSTLKNDTKYSSFLELIMGIIVNLRRNFEWEIII